MFLADVASILDSVLNFPLVLDIVLVLFLLISTSLGFAKGFWRGTWRFLFVIIMLVVSWFFIVGPVANWVRDDMFSLFKITAPVGDSSATSLGDFIRMSIEAGVNNGTLTDPKYASETYVAAFTLSLCKSIAWLLLVVIIQFVSWIISSLFYLLLIRLIIPKRVRAVKLKLLGALMGLLQAVAISFAMMTSFSSLSPAMAVVDNSESSTFSWINRYVAIVFKAFNPENSKILGPYIETIDGILGDKLFSFEEGETTYKGSTEIKNFFTLLTGGSLEEPITPPDDNTDSTTPTPDKGSADSTIIETPENSTEPVGLYHPFIAYFTFEN